MRAGETVCVRHISVQRRSLHCCFGRISLEKTLSALRVCIISNAPANAPGVSNIPELSCSLDEDDEELSGEDTRCICRGAGERSVIEPRAASPNIA